MQEPHWSMIQLESSKKMAGDHARVAFPLEARIPWTHWLADQLDALFGQLVRVFSCMMAFLFFHVLNRTVIIGKRNLKSRTRTLLLPNHTSIIDPFFVGSNTLYPRILWDPDVAPWFPAAKEVFFGGPVRAWFARRWRCIPVNRGKRDMKALRSMTARLRSGNMILFPEGTRSRNGELGPGRVGTGKLIHDVKPTLIPIYIHGLSDVLPVGSNRPRFGRKITMYIGEPMDLSNLMALPPSKRTSRLIIDQVMYRLAEMRSRVTGESVEELLLPGKLARAAEEQKKALAAASTAA